MNPTTTASGWFVLSESAYEPAGLEGRVAELQAKLDELRLSGRLVRCNGLHTLVLDGQEQRDADAVVAWVSAHLPGSYGVLTRGSDELVMRRGHLGAPMLAEEADL